MVTLAATATIAGQRPCQEYSIKRSHISLYRNISQDKTRQNNTPCFSPNFHLTNSFFFPNLLAAVSFNILLKQTKMLFSRSLTFLAATLMPTCIALPMPKSNALGVDVDGKSLGEEPPTLKKKEDRNIKFLANIALKPRVESEANFHPDAYVGAGGKLSHFYHVEKGSQYTSIIRVMMILIIIHRRCHP